MVFAIEVLLQVLPNLTVPGGAGAGIFSALLIDSSSKDPLTIQIKSSNQEGRNNKTKEANQ